MSDGEYLGHPVAIKCLRTNKGDSNSIFKVPLPNLSTTFAQLSPRGYVERLSVGNIYPTGISYLCSEFSCPQLHMVFAFSQSGCPTGM